jgi:hypothetical protein
MQEDLTINKKNKAKNARKPKQQQYKKSRPTTIQKDQATMQEDRAITQENLNSNNAKGAK